MMTSNFHTRLTELRFPVVSSWTTITRPLWLAICAAILVANGPLALAQEPEPPPEPEPRLIEREPYDQLTVKDASGNPTTFRIAQLDGTALPGRKKPEKLPATPLTVKLLERADEPRQVAWRDIVKLELFEELVLAEAEQLVAEKKTDQAYDNFDYLVRNYPKTAGLDAALQSFLYVDAGLLLQSKRYPEALAVLEELYRQNKDFAKSDTATVSVALGRVFDKVLEGYAAQKNFGSARVLLERFEKKYGAAQKPVVDKWKETFMEQAALRRDEALAHVAAGQGRAARDSVRQMNDVWPNLEGGSELIKQIAQKFPLVIVGVTQPAVHSDSRDLFNWSARRSGRLLQRTLVEYAAQGPEGGRYECPLGKVELSEDGKQLLFRLQPAPAGGALPNLTGYDISRRLLSLADPVSPDYLPAWARLVAGAEVQNVMELTVDFRRPYVAPQALLQIPLEGSISASGDSTGPYVPAEAPEGERRFLPNPKYPSRAPRAEIVERQFETPYRALAALKRGEIDVIDRLFPADVARLKGDKSVLVGRYELPTTHLLIPNAKRPYLANRTFRRAILYAIDRKAILEQGLLNGGNVPGCQVVSGPFSAGISDSDPGGYAYNRRIDPRPYDPRLAMILVQLAEQEVQNLAKDRNETPPQRPATFVLAHPADEVPRLACRVIASQLKLVGLACELKELPAGQVDTPEQDYDLLYTEVSLPEPAVDARRLLGVGGPAIAGGSQSAFALRQLESAQTWQDARKRLFELHTMTHDEVAVLPLWQLAEHYAHHPGLRGLGAKSAALYFDVEQWKIVTADK